MNELYELTLESQDIQLIVTEGIVSGSKKLINTAITKLKELLKRIVNFIKEKIQAGSKAVKALLSKIKGNGKPLTIDAGESDIKVLNLDVANTIVKSVILTQKEADKLIYSLVSDNAKVSVDDYREEIEKCDNVFAKYRDDLMIIYKKPQDLDIPKLADLNNTIMNASGKMLNSIDKLDAAINAIKNKGEEENLSPLVHNLSVVEHSLMDLTQRLNLIQGLIGITARATKRVQ
ncbi:MAG: hypothetical protein HXL57_01295 [Solobacterium sp.]|nr:hypothetical protein [Solobacterium sp.]